MEQYRRWYEINRDKALGQSKKYYETNKDKVLEYNRQYREVNKDKISFKGKMYRQTLQGQSVCFNVRAKRRSRLANQGNGVNVEQWEECMKWFNWECAYSGKKLTKENRSMDHIISLAKGGLNEIWNLVPMYRNYNSSKRDKEMLEWYKKQSFFSEEMLQKIYEWQEYAYNKWGNEDKII